MAPLSFSLPSLSLFHAIPDLPMGPSQPCFFDDLLCNLIIRQTVQLPRFILCSFHTGLVQSAVQTLQYHGVITLIPVFLYTNMYAIKPDIVNLSKDKAMQEECIRYVAREPKEGEKKVS